MRWGKIGQNEVFTESTPRWYECEGCDGEECGRCGGYGRTKIVGAVADLITPEFSMLLDFAEYARRGKWPSAAALLDETHCFFRAAKYIWNEEAKYRAKLGIAGMLI